MNQETRALIQALDDRIAKLEEEAGIKTPTSGQWCNYNCSDCGSSACPDLTRRWDGLATFVIMPERK